MLAYLLSQSRNRLKRPMVVFYQRNLIESKANSAPPPNAAQREEEKSTSRFLSLSLSLSVLGYLSNLIYQPASQPASQPTNQPKQVSEQASGMSYKYVYIYKIYI